MPLECGSRLGSYEIVGPIGAGGMGEVYQARDTALNRDVAIKVLPEALAGDAERLARFQREAEALAALNHPNIAQVYGLERSGDTPAIVMELVEGPTRESLAWPHGSGPHHPTCLTTKTRRHEATTLNEPGVTECPDRAPAK